MLAGAAYFIADNTYVFEAIGTSFNQDNKITVIPKGKLRWNCRRGMKELEVLLIPFVDHCYDGLSEEQQSTFARLLGYDDATLFSCEP